MKTFTAAAAICLVLLGLGASAAGAAEFKAASYPVTVLGNQGGSHVAAPPAGTTTSYMYFGFEGTLMGGCEFISFGQQMTKAASSLTVTPSLSECAAFGSQSGTITTNGCQNRFNITSKSGAEFLGTLDIICPEGSKIAVVGNNCEIQIGSQTNLSTVHLRNETQETDPQVAMELQISNLAYTKTKDGFLCPLSGTGAMSSGLLVAGMTLEAKEATNALRIE